MAAVSSSISLRVGTPWSEEQHWHLAPICGTGISDTLGMEDAGAGPLSTTPTAGQYVTSLEGWLVAHHWSGAVGDKEVCSDSQAGRLV